MPEKIGLLAELDLRQFNRNVTTYLSKINQMQTATQNMARAVSSSFSALSNQSTSSLGNISNAVSNLTTQVAAMRRQLSGPTGVAALTNNLRGLTQAANQAARSLANINQVRVSPQVGGGIGGIGGIGGSLGGIGGAIGSAVGGVGSAIGGIATSLASVVRSVTGLVGSVVRAFSGMASSIFRIVGSIATTVGIAFNTILRTVLHIVGSLVSGVVGAFTSIVRSVIGIIGNLVSTVVRAFTSLLGTVLGIVQNIVGGIFSAFSSLVGMVGNAISGVARAVVGAFSGLLRIVGSIVSTIGRTVVDIFSGIARSVVSIVEGMARAVLTTISNMVKKVGDILRSMAGNILDAYRDLGGKLVQIITVATVAMTGALVLVGRQVAGWFSDAISAAASFEQSMADIQAVLRATAEEVAPLGDLIDTLALDPQLVVGTAEAAAVVEQLARNGIEMSRILEGGAEAAILLANATGGGPESFAQAADVATMAMQMFGIEASELNRIADVSQGVINNSRIELEDWSLALGNGGAAAALVGVTFEDFATTIAGTVNLFHSARQAGTGAMNFFQRLVPITQVAADEMRDLGLFTGLSQEEFADISAEIAATEQVLADLDPRLVHYDELVEAHTKHLDELKASLIQGNNAFFDAQGVYVGTEEAARLLAEATADLSAEEQIESFRRIFGNDALETAIGLAQMGAERFKALREEITIQNSAMEAAKVRTETLSARWRNLGDIWATIQRKSGEGFTDMLFNLVNRLTALTGANQDKIIDFFGRMAELFNRLVDAALPWVEQQLPAIIDNLQSFAHWLVETVLQGDKAQYWFDQMSPGLRNFMERVFAVVRAVKDFAGQIMDLVGSLSKTFRPFIEFMLQNVELKDVLLTMAGAIILNVVPGVLRLVAVFVGVTKGISAVRKAWENNWGGIRSFFEQTWPKIQGPLIDFINKILTGKWKGAWDDAVQVVETVLGELEAVVPDFFKNFVNLAKDIIHGDWQGAWDNIVTITSKSFELIKKLLRDLETPFTDFIVDVLEGAWHRAWLKIQSAASTAFSWIIDSLRSLNMPFTDFIVDVLEGRWSRVWEQVKNVALAVFEWIKTEVYNLNTPFTDFITDILEGRWYEAWRLLRGVVVDAFNGIVDALDNLNHPIVEFIVDIIRGRWSEAWEDFKEIARVAFDIVKFALTELNLPFTNFILDILEGNWNSAWQKVSNVVQTAFELIKKILGDFNTPFTDFLVDVLEGNWDRVWNTLQTTAINILEGLKTYVPGWGDSFISAIQSLLQGKWGDAWNFARQGVIDVLETIKAYVPNWGVNFLSAIQLFLNGDFVGAWNSAVEGVNIILANLATLLPTWAQPFVGAIQALLRGDFHAAWVNALHGINLTLDKIKENVPTWMGNAITLLQQVLAGEWTLAWETAKTIALAALQPIRDWFDEKGKEVYDWFKTKLPESTLAAETGFATVKVAWDRFVEAITDSETQGNIDHLGSIVIKGLATTIEALLLGATAIVQFFNGDWKTGWATAQEAVTKFGELPVLNTITTWFGTTFPEAVVSFNSNIPAIQTAWNPVAEQWATTWGIIQTWWNTDVKGFFALTFTSVSDYVGVTIAQFGILTQAILTLFTGEGSITDRIAQALEISKGISELEMGFWKRDLERSTVDLSSLAKNLGMSVNKGVNEGLLEETATADDGSIIPKGLVYWSSNILGAMTKFQQDIYDKAKVIGEQTNYGYVAGLGDPSQPIVAGLNSWTQLAIDTANKGLDVKSPSGKFKDIAKFTMEGFRDGVIENMHFTFEAANDMTFEFVKRFDYILSNIPPMAAEMLERFTFVFRENFHTVYDLVQEFVYAIGDRLANLANKGNEIGRLLGEGLVSGLLSQLSAVQAAAASLATAAQTGVEVEAQITSPSKVFMRLGELMREGLMLGFGGDAPWQNILLSRAGPPRQISGPFKGIDSPLKTPNHSYNTYNSPVQIGPIYVSDKIGMAEFEYRVENILLRTRD